MSEQERLAVLLLDQPVTLEGLIEVITEYGEAAVDDLLSAIERSDNERS